MASYLSISITQNSQNVANNTSNVTVTVSIYSEASYNYEAATTEGSYCKINGTKYPFTHTFGKGTTTIYTKTLDIPHNADGTKTLSVYASFNTDVSLGTLTKSSSKELTTIPRASATRLSASSVDMGKKVTVYTDRASSNFTHKFYYKIGNGSWNLIADGIGDSYEWEVPLSLASNVPAGTSLVLNVNIDTYSGTTRIGSTHNTLTCYVPSTVVPTISEILVEDSNGYATKYSGYVQGKSVPKITITAEGNYSSISSYKVEFQGVAVTTTSNKVTLATVTKTGSQDITVTVTDARGRTASKTVSITALEYYSPLLSAKVVRCNSDGSANDEGAYMKVSCSASVAALNNVNGSTVKLRYKKKVSPAWVTKKTWTTYEVSTDIVIAVSIDSSYDVQLTATDDFTTATYATEIGTVEVILDFNLSGKGMSIGKVSEGEGFEVGWDAKFHENVEVDGTVTAKGDVTVNGSLKVNTDEVLHGGVVADYIIEQGTKDGWFYEKWASGKAVAYCYTSKSVACTSTSGNFYYGTTTLDLPTDLFISTVSVQVTAAGSTGSGYAFFGRYVWYDTYVNLLFYATVSATKTISFSIEIIGNWK